MELDAEDIARFGNAIGRFEKVLENVSERRTNNVGTATITVSAGGVGLWIAVTCCAIMMVTLFIGGFWMTNEMNRVDSQMHDRKEENNRMQSYLSAIFVNAPRLKPDDYEKKEQTK